MVKKNVLVVVGGHYHPFERGGELISWWLEETNRYTATVATDLDVLKWSAISKFDLVVMYTSGGELTADQETGLVEFVRKGGGFVGLHGAAASFQKNVRYVEMLGTRFGGHGPLMTFPVMITGEDCLITRRIPSFQVDDELYLLEHLARDCRVLATGMWKHQPQPLAYTRQFGAGNVFYFALGHDERALEHPEWRKMMVRGVDWALGRVENAPLKVGVIGYGSQYKMGRLHLKSLRDSAGFEPVAICDLLEPRRREGMEEFPGIRTYASHRHMLEKADVDLVVVVTEHASHAKLAMDCLNAGRHVITEKPFCVTTAQADALIDAAKKNRRMLSVFHNRRWDGDYLAIKDVIRRGLIGEVFQVEACMGSYGHPGHWWRSDKKISGGAFFDWGAHIVDWVLGLVPAKIVEVSGYFQEKRMWHDVTNEDHCGVMVRFSNGCNAQIELSYLAAVGKSRWRILGTEGGIFDKDFTNEEFQVVSYRDGMRLESVAKYLPTDWQAYYRNIADHLLLGERLAVTAESARRVIAVIETAEKSTKAQKALPVPVHCK